MFNKRHLTRVVKVASVLALSLSSSLLSADTFYQNNLVSSIPGLAKTTDANVVNPWGVAFSATGPFWLSNQATSTSTLYDGAGNPVSLVVSIPGGSPASGPTGQVFNGTTGFVLGSAPARFIFDNLNGTISAWNSGTTAVNVASTPGAIYTGLALAASGASNYLYAADSTGAIRVFDSSFMPVTLTGNFTDPNAQAGFVPFNIQLVGSSLYVTYAKLTPTGASLPGGYVDIFNTNGTYVSRFSASAVLNAPWGIAVAPSTFGSLGGDVLIANNGNGTINAFNPTSGAYISTLDGPNGKPLVFDDLWAIDFRPSGTNVNTNALYFAEGLNNDTGGLFGALTPAPEPASILLGGLGILAIGLYRHRSRG